MKISTKRGKLLLGAGALAAIAAVSLGTAQYAIGSDHADTVTATSRPGIDLSDLHIFPGQDTNNVVLSLCVHPLIAPGAGLTTGFDPDALYQFKIDTTGDAVEDLVIQARFQGTGANQKVFISGPVKPSLIGTKTKFEAPYAKTGVINQVFEPTPGMKVFAGGRADPFFLDLVQLGTLLPDRLSALPASAFPPLTGQKKNTIQEANTPQLTPDTTPPGQPTTPSFRAKSNAKDFFDNYNVLSIVVELPKASLGGGKIGVWETVSVR